MWTILLEIAASILGGGLGFLIVYVIMHPKPKYAIGDEVIVTGGKHQGFQGYIFSYVGRQYSLGGGRSLVWVSMKDVRRHTDEDDTSGLDSFNGGVANPEGTYFL